MSNIIQIKRGTALQVKEAILREGELVIDITNQCLYYGAPTTQSPTNKIQIGGGNTIAKAAEKLTPGATIQTNLELGEAVKFTGESNILIGVTGILPVSSGGTGQTTINDVLESFIGNANIGSTTNPVYWNVTNHKFESINTIEYATKAEGDSNAITSTYLKRDGSNTITGTLKADAIMGGGDYNSIDTNSLLYVDRTNTTTDNYFPLCGIKTNQGFWSIGHYSSGNRMERLDFAYSHNGDTGSPYHFWLDGSGFWNSGNHVVNIDSKNVPIQHWHSTTHKGIGFGVGASGTNRGIYDTSNNCWIICVDDTGFIRTGVGSTGAGQWIPKGSVRTLKSQKNTSGHYLEYGDGNGALFGIYSWVSDQRLKTNIQKTNLKALTLINNINHYTFDWKNETYGTGNVQLGYVAQQLQKIIPTAVSPIGEDQILNISNIVLIPYITKAIQELSSKVNELELRIAKLEAIK